MTRCNFHSWSWFHDSAKLFATGMFIAEAMEDENVHGRPRPVPGTLLCVKTCWIFRQKHINGILVI